MTRETQETILDLWFNSLLEAETIASQCNCTIEEVSNVILNN